MNHEVDCYLDRYEGDYAVLLVDDSEVNISRKLLPREISEGDYLTIRISVKPDQKSSTGHEISESQERLESPGDDIP